jgi:PilZ domain
MVLRHVRRAWHCKYSASYPTTNVLQMGAAPDSPDFAGPLAWIIEAGNGATTQPSTPRVERRSWPRRRRLVRVLVMPDLCQFDEPYAAVLVDSSPGGLRLSVRSGALSEGSILHVKAVGACRTAAWTRVRVRNRRCWKGQWELGCQRVNVG